MNVRDLMQPEVVTLNAADSLDLVDDIMRLGRIRHMPVLSGTHLVGIVSQRDLFRAAISSALHLRPTVEREWLAKIHVREVMTTRVVTVAPDVSVQAAVDAMIVHRIGCLPVLEDGELIGLLSETDCLRYLAQILDRTHTAHQLPELRSPD